MRRVSASVVLDVPASLCFAACRSGIEDERWAAAYAQIRKGRKYSGRVAEEEPNRRLVIEEASIDPITKRRSHKSGWRVTFDFREEAGGATRAEVGVEYGGATALVTLGTARQQAEQEVLKRLALLIAVESGFKGARASGR